MEKEIKKAPRVALCKECQGKGLVERVFFKLEVCPQCEGSGRVIVSSVTPLDIKPYRP